MPYLLASFLGLWPFLGGVARSCHGLGEGKLTLATWALRLRLAQAVSGSLPVPLVQKGQHDLRAEMDAAAIRSEERATQGPIHTVSAMLGSLLLQP